jgi:hypothetical protein
VKPQLTSSEQRLERMTNSLEADWKSGAISKEEYKLCSERLKQLTNIQNKIESLAPLAEKFLQVGTRSGAFPIIPPDPKSNYQMGRGGMKIRTEGERRRSNLEQGSSELDRFFPSLKFRVIFLYELPSDPH